MSALRIADGTVRVLFAYDIGLSIALEAARAHVAGLEADERIRHKGHAPQYFQFDPPPLRLLREIEPVDVAGRRTATHVEILLFDFGGASVGWTIPFAGTLEELVALSCALSASDDLRQRSEMLVAHILELIRRHVDRPGLADLSEDYLIFQVTAFDPPLAPDALVAQRAGDIARLLRSERDALSDQEIQEALSGRVSFGVSDVALIDWNATLLVDREPEDVVSVLEFANLELLEMRFLDEKLDRGLDRAYEGTLVPRALPALRLPGTSRAELRKIAQMQVDGAILFERVSNALKLLGDQYLARVHRTASQRFRLAEWNTGILRKLDTLESIYQKVHDQSAGLRMEALEWVIVILIAVSIVLPFLTGNPH